jgi:RNA polymerase sigma factor (sigma-70 family)
LCDSRLSGAYSLNATMSEDVNLLRRYAEDGSQADFTAFAQRHLSFVYNTALRRTSGDPHRAAEITQLVFIDVARRARPLSRHQALAGWLHVATKNIALNLARSEARRRTRETVAHQMNADAGTETPRLNWGSLSGVIDSALDELSPSDREAILARFFEARSFAEIGVQLRLSENAARMRVDRALAKLRTALRRHGIDSTGAALTTALSQPVMATVPAGLSTSACGAAFASATAPAVGWIAFLAMNKVKTAAIAALAAAMLTPPLVELRANRQLRAELSMLRDAHTTAARENSHLAEAATHTVDDVFSTDFAELNRLRARAAVLRTRPDGVIEREIKSPTNRGWDTPDAALETIQWAFLNGDWATMARAFSFDTDAKTKADTFFASLPSEIRQTYQTPERFFGHAWYEASQPQHPAWTRELQVIDVERVDGPEPMRVRAWGRTGTGRELMTIVRFEHGANGWAMGASYSTDILQKLIAKLDPATGNPRPAKAP